MLLVVKSCNDCVFINNEYGDLQCLHPNFWNKSGMYIVEDEFPIPVWCPLLKDQITILSQEYLNKVQR